jgi:hypothetical protein
LADSGVEFDKGEAFFVVGEGEVIAGLEEVKRKKKTEVCCFNVCVLLSGRDRNGCGREAQAEDSSVPRVRKESVGKSKF